VVDKRPQADRILVAQLTGEAGRHAKWRKLTEAEHAAAVGELRELAAGRADLLAEVAGIAEGFTEGTIEAPLARSAADLCRAAGADPDAIEAWIAVGRRRRASADQPPFSGGLHGGGAPRRSLRPAHPGAFPADRLRRGGFCRAALEVVDAGLAGPRDHVTWQDDPRASGARTGAGRGAHDERQVSCGPAGCLVLGRVRDQ
jgi:hypothetical protein